MDAHNSNIWSTAMLDQSVRAVVDGITSPMASQAIENCTGRSAMGTDKLTKTLRMGLNFPHLGTMTWTPYNVTKNMRYRLGGFFNTTLDSSGKPIAMGSTWVTAQLYDNNGPNSIDATSYPCVTGLYAIGWDDLAPSTPTTFYLIPSDTTTTVTERTGLANPGSGGIGKVKVFDIQRSSTSTVVSLAIGVGISNSAKTPSFDNLAINGPGDFIYAASTPTVLDNSDPYALSKVFVDRMSNSLGSARWVDSTIDFAGIAPYADPECLRELTDFTWCGIFKKSWFFRYSQARPFVPASSFIYSSEMGSSFPATLGASIDAVTTTLAITDAATAPVIIGLILTIDSEKMRVMGVSGTTVTVIRGCLGTTAASHSAGAISVNYRFPVSSLGQLGASNGLVTEFVSSDAHGMKTGEVVHFRGTPWPDFTYTDGTIANYAGFDRACFVTGANSFVIAMFTSNSGPPMTLSAPVALNPSVHQSWSSEPGVPGFPFDFIAKTTSRLPGCDIHVNVPSCSSDSMVDEIARRIRDNFAAGRNVWLELSNEIWNAGMYPITYFNAMNRLLYPANLPGNEFYLVRSGQVLQRFRDIFSSGGRNRGSEIRLVLNMHPKTPDGARDFLSLARSHGVEVSGIAIGPYTDSDASSASVTAYTNYDTSQSIDLWIHDIYHNVTGDVSWPSLFSAFNSHIDAYNAATGFKCALYAYEGGVQYGLPTFNVSKLRDMIYNPNWYIIEQDFYALWQANRFIRANIYAYAMNYVSGTAWGMYHWSHQPYGRGDGSDGKADNRLTLAQTKPSTVNLDQANVSVRGQAIRDWVKMASAKRRKPRIAR